MTTAAQGRVSGSRSRLLTRFRAPWSFLRFLRAHELHGFPEQVAHLMAANRREPHEDRSITSIVMSHVVSVGLLIEP